MPFLDGVKHWYVRQKLRQATITAALAGAGDRRMDWPVSTPTDDLLPATQSWLTQALATVRTPHGIDSCSLILKIVEKSAGGRWRRLWMEQLPTFTRHAPQTTYQQLAETLQSLPLSDYPMATHIELQLVSIGDIVAYYDRNQ